MNLTFYCSNKDRWKKVSASSSINGIDYLEVVSPSQKKLKLYFLHPLPGQTGGIPASPPLTKENIFIDGGVRIKSVKVTKIGAQKHVLNIEVDQAGDFSTYTLKIGTSSTKKDTPPTGFDQQLSSIEFSFKVNCPTDFDCKTDDECQEEIFDEPVPDYLAKDYGSFNRLMLDRLNMLMPSWKERHAADLQVTLIELLAYVGDHLSYYQDAVGTEAYLHTARRRVSLKRHARLLDYSVHEGCNARTWVQLQVNKGSAADGMLLNSGTVLLSNGDENMAVISSAAAQKFMDERDPAIFETMHALTLNSAHNCISFYTWEDSHCCLPEGATSATLVDDGSLTIKKGDALLLEEIYSPLTGMAADADARRRHVVRISEVEAGITDALTGTGVMNIRWYDDDALPFSLCLNSEIENELQAGDESLSLNEKSVARGNLVLADFGYTQQNTSIVANTDDNTTYYPELPEKEITVAVPYEHEEARKTGANTILVQNPHEALPVVSLFDGREVWRVKQDILGSDRFAKEFVVETEQDGTAHLRFGDDQSGKKPANDFTPLATYRKGNGRRGNVGPGAINTIVCDNEGISLVRNPLAAQGGTEAETMTEIRQFAPYAFRKQERAVTEADYVEKTELHPDVQQAAAKFYWTGSWYTVYVIIDRREGKDVDDAFKADIIRHLEQYRLAGYDLEIRGPRYVPLQISMNVCVQPGYFLSEIRKQLLETFGNKNKPDGQPGFFHPDNFSFGQAVYLSAIYKAAMQIEGIASVELTTFRRWTGNQLTEITDGFLQPAELEIIRLDNDPSLPENGRIDFNLFGGL